MNNKNKPRSAIKKQCEHIVYVYSSKDNSFGIERLIRCILVVLPFVYPTLYIRYFAGKLGLRARKLAVEVNVLIKILFLFLLIIFLINSSFSTYISVYFLSDTLFYLLAIILLSDIYSKPSSKNRSFILLFINYIEINLAYSILYFASKGITNLNNNIDAIYFSFVTFTTLGYGDFYPVSRIAKILVISQLLIMILFVFLFFFNLSPKMQNNNN